MTADQIDGLMDELRRSGADVGFIHGIHAERISKFLAIIMAFSFFQTFLLLICVLRLLQVF
jgi:hypothetical protein